MSNNTLFDKTNIDISISDEDFGELKNRCFRPFGYPTVAVEVGNEDFKYMIKSALQLLNTWLPMIKYHRFNVTADVGEYTFDEYDNISNVLDIYVSQTYLYSIGMPISMLMTAPLSLACSNDISLLNDHVSLMSAYNTAKNWFQVEPRAEIIRPNILRVLPKPYISDEWVAVLTLNHENNLGLLSNWEREWLINYLTCQVGKFIGNIRRKYSGVTLPVGSLGDTGSNIYSESVETEKELLQDLKNYKRFAESYIAIG